MRLLTKYRRKFPKTKRKKIIGTIEINNDKEDVPFRKPRERKREREGLAKMRGSRDSQTCLTVFFKKNFVKSVNCLFIIEVWVGFITLSKLMIVID